MPAGLNCSIPNPIHHDLDFNGSRSEYSAPWHGPWRRALRNYRDQQTHRRGLSVLASPGKPPPIYATSRVRCEHQWHTVTLCGQSAAASAHRMGRRYCRRTGKYLAVMALPARGGPGQCRHHTLPGTPINRGTEVRVRLEYTPPSGIMGLAVAQLFKTLTEQR